jgi:hypothetical protein
MKDGSILHRSEGFSGGNVFQMESVEARIFDPSHDFCERLAVSRAEAIMAEETLLQTGGLIGKCGNELGAPLARA